MFHLQRWLQRRLLSSLDPVAKQELSARVAVVTNVQCKYIILQVALYVARHLYLSQVTIACSESQCYHCTALVCALHMYFIIRG